MGLYIFIQTPFGQNWIARQITKRFSRDLQTKITIGHVNFTLFNKMHLEGVLIEDQKGDTVLYAGDMKVRITDWFFFKKEAELKYVSLENAIVKFQRTDSIWRQQFILDYFSSPDSTSKKKAGIKINLKVLELKNVLFMKKDAWMGQDMSVHVNALNMEADTLSLSGNEYDIRSLFLQDPVVTMNNYPGLKPRDTRSKEEIDDMMTTSYWNRGQTIVKLGNLKIVNGTFRNDKQNGLLPLGHFDGNHMLFTQINGEWSNSTFIGDTVYSVMRLSAKERSGLELKKFDAIMRMTPQGMSFTNMELVTNRSTLKDYFSMSYNDITDMADFIHKVKLAAVFEDSYVHSDDLAFFAPNLSKWKKKISVSGKLRGTVSDLAGRDMLIQAGNGTVLDGDISLTGLPDINRTFIDFKANEFRTTYGDAVTFIPAIRRVSSPDLRKIRYVNFRGNFTGFIRDFVTFGTIQTNLGTVSTDLNMKLPYGKEPVYSGKISTGNFRLGEFLGDGSLGDISFSAVIRGTGFSDKTRNTTIDGTVRYIDFNKYRYSNIAIDGRLDKKMFEGVASIKDENADLSLNGIIDFNNPSPRFKLLADITHADLRRLQLTRDSLTFRGKADLDFTSNSIDDFIGYARITDAELTRKGRRLPFDSLIVSAGFDNGIKTLKASSNEFKATISGDYSIEDLPAAFTHYLNKYYPAYVKAPRRIPQNQDISFDIETYNVDEYLQMINPALVGFNNARITGNLNQRTNELNLTADVPQFKFKGYNFDKVLVVAKGSADSLVITGETGRIRINDSLTIPQAKFRIGSRNDSSRVSVITGVTQGVERADLNALVLTYNDGVKIEFDPSSFNLNGKTWTIGDNGELVLRRNTPASGSLILSEGDQRILVKTQPSAKGTGNDIKVELVSLNLGDLGPLFLPNNRLEGLLSGNILVEDPTKALKISSTDLQTKFLRLDNDSLGEVKASLVYDNITKELKINGNTLNQDNHLSFDANIFIGDAEKAKNNLIALKARNYEIKILERFLGNLFTDMQGYLTGDVNIGGPFNRLSVTGSGRLRNAGLRVNFTQVFYRIADTDISLTPVEIKLDGLVLTDTVTGNPVYLTGGIEHESFRNMFYNLDVSTRRPGTTGAGDNRPVQLLKTTYRHNKQFFGDVKGTGSLSLLGPQSNMFMKIDVVASEEDSSYITLPPSSSRETGIADFLVERKYGREMTETDLRPGSTNIIYDVDISINKTPTPMVSVRVILDELTGDEIKGKGNGSLNIRSGTTEPLSLRGRFDIEEGNYLFTFQSFFKKPFELRREGENYIEWNGDPYDANIKFEAIYRAERVNFRPLGQFVDINPTARGDVYVVASLSDKLFKPKINFSLDFPRSSIAVTDPELALVIQNMQRNPNEVTRQVTYLIVFNSFAPSEQSGGSDYSVANLGLTTISGILLNVISEQINKLLGNLFKSEKYNINLNTSFYTRDTRLDLGSNINFSIGRSFFNNRFIVTTGVGFDAPIQQSSSSQAYSQQLLPDVTLEWLINPSGTIRASFFYRENTDYLTTANTGGPGKAKRIGANLSYRKDFDRFRDLFKKKPAPAPVIEEKKPETPPVIEEKKPEPAPKGGN